MADAHQANRGIMVLDRDDDRSSCADGSGLQETMQQESGQTPGYTQADARMRFADVLIDPADIELARDSLGMQRIIGKGAFGHVCMQP